MYCLQLLLLLSESAVDSRKRIVAGIVDIFCERDKTMLLGTLNSPEKVSELRKAKKDSLKHIYAAVWQTKDLGSKVFKSVLKERTLLDQFPTSVALTLAGNSTYRHEMITMLVKGVKDLASFDEKFEQYITGFNLLEEYEGRAARTASNSSLLTTFQKNISSIVEDSVGGPSSLVEAILEFGYYLLVSHASIVGKIYICP